MRDSMNKTLICSILFLDIIDYSKKSGADQIAVKNQFNDLVYQSLKDIAENERIILDTGDGVAIAHQGSPEDAMFMALSIRDGILKSNTQNNNMQNPVPLYVRFGINLGPVRIVSDINGQPNIIGDGINTAQRIMSFAEPNQILVSRSYYEVASRLTLELSEMFAYSGLKHDKHVREHEVYSVRSHQAYPENSSQIISLKDVRRLADRLAITAKVNRHYIFWALPVILAFILIGKQLPDSSHHLDELNAIEVATEPELPSTARSAKTSRESETSTVFGLDDKEGRLKSLKSRWESFKESIGQGIRQDCTQAEISMNQCRD